MNLKKIGMVSVPLNEIPKDVLDALVTGAKKTFQSVSSEPIKGNIYHVDYMREFTILEGLVSKLEEESAMYLFVQEDTSDVY